MDNQRLLIWAFFALMLWMTYQTWVQDYGPKPVQPTADPGTAVVDAPEVPAAAGQIPEITEPEAAPRLPDVTAGEAADTSSAATVIRVSTDVFNIEIDPVGGTLSKAVLKKYPVHKDDPNNLVRLLTTDRADLALIESGIRGSGDGPEATHLTTFESERTNYELNGDDELVVRLTWRDESGVTIEKRFRFYRGSYEIGLEQEVRNGSEADWAGAEYIRIRRHSAEIKRTMFDVDSYSFDGPIIYNGEKAEKLKRKDLLKDGKVEYYSSQGWFGSIQHHFVRAVVPTPGTEYRYQVAVSTDVATSSAIGRAAQPVPAGESRVFETKLFVGPKLQAQLEQIDESLKLTVDYGWLTIISQPLFWLLSLVYEYVANWGVAIIVVTFLIKLAFYKLTESSGRSMAKMRNLQPRMKALQDRYKDDRQALSQAMMDLYKREKVNPAAGCLPILIQMPFFLAFYWVLLESVEMRQAPFALWITDLSTRDPFFILPLLMGAAMFFQQRLNPPPPDPMQAKVMQFLPVIFTAMFAFFPAGLVLYWLTNSVLSMAQQWRINKVIGAD